MMKERPILFSGPMVQALLDGSKTQTRRVVKADFMHDPKGSLYAKWYFRGARAACWDSYETLAELVAQHCPYGQPGDRLWVREKWSGEHCYHQDPPSQRVSVMTPDGPMFRDAIWYWADGEPEYGDWERPRPSIHMPRWASRITLEVTGVRVERLQDICEADALAEGVQGHPFRPDDGWPICTGYMVGPDDGKTTLHPKPQDAYHGLWEKINGPESWEANPWVWVVEFKRA